MKEKIQKELDYIDYNIKYMQEELDKEVEEFKRKVQSYDEHSIVTFVPSMASSIAAHRQAVAELHEKARLLALMLKEEEA